MAQKIYIPDTEWDLGLGQYAYTSKSLVMQDIKEQYEAMGESDYEEAKDDGLLSCAELDLIGGHVDVVTTQDESSHWYIIPADLSDRFGKLCEILQCEEDYESAEYQAAEQEMEETYGKYRTGGGLNNYQLSISEEELKRLTGE